MRLSLALVLALSQISFRLCAQVAQPSPLPTPPPGPLIQKRAPDFAQWVVRNLPVAKTNQDGDSGKSSQKSPPDSGKVKAVFIKTGQIIRVAVVDDRKRVWNIWVTGSQETLEAVEWPDKKNVGHVPNPTATERSPFYFDFSKSDFDGFDWLSPSNFVGIQDVMGRKCLVFSSTRRRGGAYDVTITACTDLETRYPVSLVDENGPVTFQFLAPPSAMQTLPITIQAMMNKESQTEQALAPGPGKPY
jgi:hypothetical protein